MEYIQPYLASGGTFTAYCNVSDENCDEYAGTAPLVTAMDITQIHLLLMGNLLVGQVQGFVPALVAVLMETIHFLTTIFGQIMKFGPVLAAKVALALTLARLLGLCLQFAQQEQDFLVK